MKRLMIPLLSMLLLGTYAQASDTTHAHQSADATEVKMIQPTGSFPVFIVNSFDNVEAYYSENFSFGVAFQNEWYIHLISESGIQVGFLLPDQPTQPEIFKQQFDGDGVIFSFEVQDADLAYAYAQEQSLDIVLELVSEEWGQRHFAVRDPNGVYLDIIQATTPTEEYQEGFTDIAN